VLFGDLEAASNPPGAEWMPVMQIADTESPNPISSVHGCCLRVVLDSDLTTKACMDVRSTSYCLILLLSLLDSLYGEKSFDPSAWTGF
jgi:hypothetical protein